ncbi:hypothetical protein Uis1B_2178 [Bifidobacterium margollesii]|uniref:Uncharacterized protein n=2 Tax=Bifidobacterium margollesii TaxID=2020964 RepID=A0A2N5J720_9BIFI|nr:hypothetical protein Uis1B_2178 [Bifidobacterium margollesii]
MKAGHVPGWAGGDAVVDVADFRGLEEYRQWLLMFRLLRDYPEGLIRSRGLARLPRIEARVRGSYYHGLVAEWRETLKDPDPDRLRSVALDVSQKGIDMRSIMPFAGVMGREDLMRVIGDSRNEWGKGFGIRRGPFAHR